MSKQPWRSEVVEWAKTLGAAFVAYLAFTTVAFAQYRIPSESMAAVETARTSSD